MKKFTLLLSAMLLSVMSFAGEYAVTISFADKAQRTVYTNEQQVWEQNGIVVTNDKSESTTNVGDYANPARFYKSSALTVKCTYGTIKRMEFTCGTQSGKDYPADLVASVGSEATADGLVVTIVPTASSDTYTIAKFTNQVRVASIKVTYEGEAPENGGGNEGGGNDSTIVIPPAEGVITCAQAVEICKATGETATTDKYTIRGYVTEIKDPYNTQYGNISYWMADEKGGGQVLQAYRVKPVNASDQAVKVNDYVEVVGALVNYYGNTPEVPAGGTYTIITVGEEGEKPSLPEGLTGDGTKENPFTVEDVLKLNNQFAGPYYVKAFIVGQVNGASLESGAEFDAPFTPSKNSTTGEQYTYNTNLLVASSADVKDVAKCLPVQLPQGDLRNNFNLPENPEMDGEEVLICGGLVAYFKVPGIKSTSSIELLNVDTNVVNVKGLVYADAYYYVEDGVAYFDFDLYKEFDVDAYTYTYPEVYTIVEANSKTAINGTYDMLYAGYWTTANDSIEIGDALGKLTIQNVDTEGNYSFKGSFVGTDGKTYKFDQTVSVWAYDYDNEEDIILNENSTAVANIATDDVKTTKIIRKGQLLIQEGDKIYNILGVEVK